MSVCTWTWISVDKLGKGSAIYDPSCCLVLLLGCFYCSIRPVGRLCNVHWLLCFLEAFGKFGLDTFDLIQSSVDPWYAFLGWWESTVDGVVSVICFEQVHSDRHILFVVQELGFWKWGFPVIWLGMGEMVFILLESFVDNSGLSVSPWAVGPRWMWLDAKVSILLLCDLWDENTS